MTVPHAPASAAVTRRQLAAGLVGVSEDLVDDAMLVLTELVGNAVLHARPLRGHEISVGWRRQAGYLELWVTDGGSDSERPTPQHPSPYEVHGRGLTVVDAISDSWGVQRDAGSATVWARIALPASPEADRGVQSETGHLDGSDRRRVDRRSAGGSVGRPAARPDRGSASAHKASRPTRLPQRQR